MSTDEFRMSDYSRSGDWRSGLSLEADQALAVIERLCGGKRFVEIVGRSVNWIEVEAVSSDSWGPRRITIGMDGGVQGA